MPDHHTRVENQETASWRGVGGYYYAPYGNVAMTSETQIFLETGIRAVALTDPRRKCLKKAYL